MERFVIIVNSWKHSILDVAAALDQPLKIVNFEFIKVNKRGQKCLEFGVLWKVNHKSSNQGKRLPGIRK